MASVVALRWCIGSIPVNLQEEKDSELLTGGRMDLWLLDFSRQGELGLRCFEEALCLKARTFRKIHWALLKEIDEALADERKVHHHSKRASRRPNAILEVTVRGHKILVKNNKHALRIGIQKDQEKQELEWLLQELRKDLDVVEQASSSKRQAVRGPGPKGVAAPAPQALGGPDLDGEAEAQASGQASADPPVPPLEEKGHGEAECAGENLSPA
jgi:hypothetical protein